MEKQRCVVICAGEQGDMTFSPEKTDFVICCDAGLRAAERLGITPDLIMGDFDSYEGELPEGIETKRFPVEKDDTDSMLALREGLKRGFKNFLLLFSLGGRLDHTMANIQALAFLEENGACGELLGAEDSVKLLKNGKMEIPYREGWNFSLFAFGQTARGVTLTGMQYPLENADITQSFPIGMGNHLIAPKGSVSVREGALLIMRSKIR